MGKESSILVWISAEHLFTVGGRHDEVAIAISPDNASSDHLVDQVCGGLGDLLLILHNTNFLLKCVIVGQFRRSLLLLD